MEQHKDDYHDEKLHDKKKEEQNHHEKEKKHHEEHHGKAETTNEQGQKKHRHEHGKHCRDCHDSVDAQNECVENEASPDDQQDVTMQAKEGSSTKLRGKETEQFEALKKKSDEYLSMLQRTLADFENYKKRTNREKETIYQDIIAETVALFLPVLDNLERAIRVEKNAGTDTNADNPLRSGLTLLLKQFNEILRNGGVVEIEALGKTFDPQKHNAVMHVQNDENQPGEVIEELLKGYMLGEKVIRHSMVKVAN